MEEVSCIVFLVLFREKKLLKKEGPTEIWTQIAGFKVQSANHYTIGLILFFICQIM